MNAVKIIKPGDLSRLETVRRFECDLCGCVWEAGPAEYSTCFERNEIICACACPTCNALAWSCGEEGEMNKP